MVYVHMGQRTHSGRRSGSRSRYSELYSQDKLQTEKGRPGEYQVFNYSSGRRSRTPTRPHYHDRAGINRDELEGLWTKGERSNTRRIKPDKDFLLSGVATYMMNNRKGKRKWRGSKNLVKPKEPYQKLFKVQKKDR